MPLIEWTEEIHVLDHVLQGAGLMACAVGLWAALWALRDLRREWIIAGDDPIDRLLVKSHAPLLLAVVVTQVGFAIIQVIVMYAPALPLLMYQTPEGILAIKVILLRKFIRAVLVTVLMAGTLINARYRHRLLSTIKAARNGNGHPA